MSRSNSTSDQLYQQMGHPAGVAFMVDNPLVDHWLACWNGSDPLLDIGCGSCHNSQKAVDIGARVCATEMCENTLTTLKEQQTGSPDELSFHLLKLPAQVGFPDGYFSGILCSEVFHFLNHEEILASIAQLYRLLIPGGKVVLTCACEEIKAFKPVDLKKIKETHRQATPERLDPIFDYLDFLDQAVNLHAPDHPAWKIRELHREIQPRTFFNFINHEQLANAFINAGFEIEQITTGPAPYYPLWEHGDNDQVRLIAVKLLNQF